MVLEMIVKPSNVEKYPSHAFLLGLVLSTIGIFLGMIVFPDSPSVAAILFATVGGVPFLRRILDIEEIREEQLHSLIKLFKRNEHLLKIYGMFFIGVAVAYAIWFKVFPIHITAGVFGRQLAVITSPASGILGNFLNPDVFSSILSHNIQVLIIIMAMSLLYGAGAIIILSWNASVLGVYLANFRELSEILPLFPHIFLEFIAFFLAAMAGGLLSVGFEKQKIRHPKYNKVMEDVLILMALSVVTLILAAFVETTLAL